MFCLLYVWLFVCLSVWLVVCWLLVCLVVSLFDFLYVWLFICLVVSLFGCFSIWLFVCLVFVCLYVCFFCMFGCLSVWLFVYLVASLFGCLSVWLFFWLVVCTNDRVGEEGLPSRHVFEGQLKYSSIPVLRPFGLNIDKDRYHTLTWIFLHNLPYCNITYLTLPFNQSLQLIVSSHTLSCLSIIALTVLPTIYITLESLTFRYPSIHPSLPFHCFPLPSTSYLTLRNVR